MQIFISKQEFYTEGGNITKFSDYLDYLNSECHWTPQKLNLLNDVLSNDEYSDDEELYEYFVGEGFNFFEASSALEFRPWFFSNSLLVCFCIDNVPTFVSSMYMGGPASFNIVDGELVVSDNDDAVLVYFGKMRMIEPERLNPFQSIMLSKSITSFDV